MTPDLARALPILVVAFDGKVFGLEPTTGREVWRYEIGAYVPAVAFDGERVFVAATGHVAALDYLSGRELWRHKSEFGATKQIVVAQGGLVFVAWASEVECFTRDGRRLWGQPFKGQGYHETALGFPGNFVHAFHDQR